MNTHTNILPSPPPTPTFVGTAFNQNVDCFVAATASGFCVYTADPVLRKVERRFPAPFPLAAVCMLHRTNYLALVGLGSHPQFPSNRVVIWDDLKLKPLLSLEFELRVVGVHLSRMRIVAVLENAVHIYGFSSPPTSIAVYPTATNLHAVAALSLPQQADLPQLLVFPSKAAGQLQIVDVSPKGQEKNVVRIIRAHRAAIRAVAVDRDGRWVASASETGTIIRVHDANTTQVLHEFRRGLDKAIITSMAFSPDGSKLAVLSDKMTLHVYAIGGDGGNRRHVLDRWALVPGYFHSTWLEKSVRTGDGDRGEGVLGWSGPASIVVVWQFAGVWERYSVGETLQRAAWKTIEE